MVEKISLINFKGGVAKTTTSVNFAAELAKRNNDVLLVDLDPQSNASMWLLGKERFLSRVKEVEKTAYQLFLDELPPYSRSFKFKEAIVKAVVRDSKGHNLLPHLDLIPNTYKAIDLENKLLGVDASFSILKDRMDDIQDQYDFIIFDCAPNLYRTTVNALLFSNYYIVPVYPDYFARAGLKILTMEIKNKWDRLGKWSEDNLRLLGVVITRIKENAELDKGRRVGLEQELNDLIKNDIVSSKAEVFETYFNDTVEVPRSVEEFIPTILYKQSNPQVKKYTERIEEFTDDVLENIKK